MIVCTCDACGRVTESWTTLRIELPGSMTFSEHREICLDCQKTVRNKAQAFIDEITVTEREVNDE